jgi:long-chain acyl-CoA synthetase
MALAVSAGWEGKEMETTGWRQHYPPDLPTGLDYPLVPLHQLLTATAGKYPDKPALVFANSQITYRELDSLVDTLAAGLQSCGVNKGDRVALFLPNCPQMVIGYFAAWRAGAIAVPVNPAYVAREFEHQITDAGATLAICLDSLWEQVQEAATRSTLRHVIITGIDDFAANAGTLAAPTPTDGCDPFLRYAAPAIVVHRLGHLVSRIPRGPQAVAVAVDDTAALLYTGGTTGVPKGTRLTHRNLVTNAFQIAAWLVNLVEGKETVLTALPLTHSYSLTMCMNQAVCRGYTQVLIPNPRQMDQMLAAIEKHRVSLFPGVPAMFSAINQHPSVRAGQHDLTSIKACISGAAPLPAEVQREFQRITGGRLVEGYGLTEAAPITHCNPLHSGGRIGTIGVPLPNTDCMIVDSDTETQQMGPEQPGVLCVSGPQVMTGYWGMPAETAAVLRPDHAGRMWLHTGDIAVMSTDGYFRIVDRKKDTIIAAGGLKAYPREVEDVLYEHPDVADAAVIGVPVGGDDQRVKAFIVLRQGAQTNEEDLRSFCRQRLARYKVPRHIEFRSALPRSSVGKVLRRQLAEEEQESRSARPQASTG